MNDPISALQAPPPRYLLESDSSDEEGQGEYAASSSRRSIQIQPTFEITLEWSETRPQSLTSVIIGVGQVGRYLTRKAGGGKGDHDVVMKVKVGRAEVGRARAFGDSLVLELEDGEGEEAWKVSEKLVEEIKDVKWTLITAYVPAMYIPDPDRPTVSGPDAPIRLLSMSGLGSDGVATWDSPNYLTGIAGAFTSLAIHPAFALQSSALSTLVLPLPLSGLNSANVLTALSAGSPAFASILAEKQKAASRDIRWDEADDEPYSASGMGGGRRLGGKSGNTALDKEEISSMYM